jgi:hypothetical protein
MYSQMYLNVFSIFLIFIYNYLPCLFNVFAVHFNVFIMYLNIFINIVIGILPSHSHYNVYAMRPHLHIYFSLSTMTPFPICLPLPHFLPFPLIHSNFHTICKSITYQFVLFTFIYYPILHIPHHH